MSETVRLSLPFIMPGQAQKELFHNEALQRLDMIVQPLVEGAPANQPPDAPVAGQAYLVGSSPQGEWAEQAKALAAWTESGWRFVAPFEGMEVSTRSGIKFRYADGSWVGGKVIAEEVSIGGQKVLGVRTGPIADPVAGSVIDQQARAAIANVLAALRQHGLIAFA